MKNLLITWSIRDGDNEYDEEVIIKTDEEGSKELFEKVLTEFYGWTVTYNEDMSCYEIDTDYRLIDDISTQEISEETKKVLLDVHLVTDMVVN